VKLRGNAPLVEITEEGAAASALASELTS
jgi:hypothetical protein